GVGRAMRLLERCHHRHRRREAATGEEIGRLVEALLMLGDQPLVLGVLRDVVIVIGGALETGEILIGGERLGARSAQSSSSDFRPEASASASQSSNSCAQRGTGPPPRARPRRLWTAPPLARISTPSCRSGASAAPSRSCQAASR